MDTPQRHRDHRARFRGLCGLRGSVVIVFEFVAFLAIPLLLTASLLADDPRAEAMFRELEEKLLNEKSLRLRFKITSEGPVNSSLQGQLRLKSGNRVEIDVSGSFKSNPVSVHFESDGKKMRWALADRQIDLETPKGLNQAIIVGFTRMGLLHNLAMILGGEPPDRADGTVGDWVQVSDFLFAAPDPSSKVRGRSIRFQIEVDGKGVGDADYWISPLTRVPVERRQTVHLKTGDMKVVETYEFPD